jgi:medium-chain acyl-[acyl-carrier-protein] hydrolase
MTRQDSQDSMEVSDVAHESDSRISATGGRVHEQEFRIRFSDCTTDWLLSAQGALRFFEEIALLQSEALGVGRALYERAGVAWLLSRWDLRMHADAPFDERVRVRTQPRDYRRSFAQRLFEARRADGSLIAKARSEWVFVETARRRPVRVIPAIIAAYGVLEETVLPPFEEPEAIEEATLELRFPVRASDLDHNGHVNNVRYVDWAFDPLPAGLLAGRRCTRLSVRYLREVLHPGSVLSRADVREGADGLFIVHGIAGADGEACRINSWWTTALEQCAPASVD